MARFFSATLITLFIGIFAAAACADVTFVSQDAIRESVDALPQTGAVSTGQPDKAILQNAAEAGFVAVIDLRTEGEDRGLDEEAETTALGMDYISLPISGRTGITFENAAALDEILAGVDGPVLLHCGSGNRVGALIALSQKSQGASAEEALAAGRAAGMTRSEESVRELLESQ